MSKTYETKLTVNGEFDPNREGPSEMNLTTNVEPKITFNASGDFSRPVMTIEADGKIILHDDADPTEAAKQCLDAMQHLLQEMLQRREDETRAALARRGLEVREIEG